MIASVVPMCTSTSGDEPSVILCCRPSGIVSECEPHLAAYAYMHGIKSPVCVDSAAPAPPQGFDAIIVWRDALCSNQQNVAKLVFGFPLTYLGRESRCPAFCGGCGNALARSCRALVTLCCSSCLYAPCPRRGQAHPSIHSAFGDVRLLKQVCYWRQVGPGDRCGR